MMESSLPSIWSSIQSWWMSSLPSIWSSIQSWSTPTVLFILVNAAIVIIFSTTKKNPEPKPPHQLSRTSSLYQTLKSFNLYRQNTIQRDPEPLEPIGAVEAPEEPNDRTHLSRIQSDTLPTAGEIPEKLSQKMKKSASENSTFDHFHDQKEEEKMVGSDGGPSSVRARPVLSRGDEKVDEKADDFISKFKQQLKLQRFDSFLRYKEMLNRGK